MMRPSRQGGRESSLRWGNIRESTVDADRIHGTILVVRVMPGMVMPGMVTRVEALERMRGGGGSLPIGRDGNL